MIGIPINANSVYVSKERTECYKYEFDATYPIQLNGIINQSEYVESIDRINQIYHSMRKLALLPLICFAITAVIIAIAPLVLVTPGPRTSASLVPILLAVFFSIFGLLAIALVVINKQGMARLRQAVAEESAKYSSRSPTPCSWRLETARYFARANGTNRAVATFHIVIDIGRSATSIPYNNQSFHLLGEQNVHAPPSYSSISGGFCSQCGVARSDSSAKFCSSCGQTFDKH